MVARDGRGPWHYDDAKAVIEESFSRRLRIHIDENHSTDTAAKLGLSAPARGFITEMEERADGIWGRVDWNESGRALLSDRAYWGLSPVLSYDKTTGRVLVGTPTTDALSARITAVEDQAFAESPIYETTAEGIAATGEGDRFRVENGDAAIAYDIYDHDAGGVATFVTDIPAGSALATKLTSSANLADVADPDVARSNLGAGSASVLSDVSLAVGDVAARTQGIYSDDEVIQFDPVAEGAADGETGMVFAITDANDQACLAISPEGGVYIAQLYTQNFVFDALSAETYAIEDDTSLGYAFAIADANERIGFGVRQTGEVDIKGGARLGGQAAGWDFVIVDGNDRIGMGLKDGVLYVPQISAEGQTTSNTNLRNMLFSDNVALTTPMVQLPVAQYNTIMNYGQSLGEGNETWPSLSKLWQQGAMMVGDNVDNLGVETYDAMGVA
ncbi:MAG: hypothetical protein HWE37_10485, partial [Rhodobacteraceae bacterium]|nr:hypothetical protein [Paracoccaceae bacterium]